MPRHLKAYRPPTGDEPLDEIEEALVRMLVRIGVRKVREEMRSETLDTERGGDDRSSAPATARRGEVRWLKVPAAAKAWVGGVHAKTLYAAIRAGKLQAARIGAGRNVLVCEEYVNTWLRDSGRESSTTRKGPR